MVQSIKGQTEKGQTDRSSAELRQVKSEQVKSEQVKSEHSKSGQPRKTDAVASEKAVMAEKQPVLGGEYSTSQAVSVVKTLAVDIGGSGVKALLLDDQGEALGERDRIKTPKPATPEAVIEVIERLAENQPGFDRISVGFPGVVRRGVVYTAVNLHETWQKYDLAGELTTRLGNPVRVANDADLQGMGAISGEGTELVVTLGTGFGTAMFTDGHLVPNIELAHHRFRKGQTYEEQLGRAALKKVGRKTWNARLLKAIDSLSRTLNYDRLYIGGGEVKQIEVDLPENVTVISNLLGLLGGIKLWQ